MEVSYLVLHSNQQLGVKGVCSGCSLISDDINHKIKCSWLLLLHFLSKPDSMTRRKGAANIRRKMKTSHFWRWTGHSFTTLNVHRRVIGRNTTVSIVLRRFCKSETKAPSCCPECGGWESSPRCWRDSEGSDVSHVFTWFAGNVDSGAWRHYNCEAAVTKWHHMTWCTRVKWFVGTLAWKGRRSKKRSVIF